MKGDFSRSTFQPDKHYSRVAMQQGRVQVDADWNEQQEIVERRLDVETIDIVGVCGAPSRAPGFAITTLEGKKLLIGAGRIYVDGLPCENEASTPYDQQPDFPNAPDIFKLFSGTGKTGGIVYLDVWRRQITALEDPHIREVALNGPDTATRVKTVWQVRVLPTASALACNASIPEWDALVAPSTATLNARTVQTNGTTPCSIPPSAGYQRLENQLYRVEIHKPGAVGSATFKWSRDNASVVTSIENVNGKDVTVHSVGPDDILGFANGQTVELFDDTTELNGLPGQLLTIDTVQGATRVIALSTAPAALDLTRNPRMRRWDSTGDIAVNIPPSNGGWIPLEAGIQVQFGKGNYNSGDYWLIPARTATGEIEWPPFQVPNAAPIPEAPVGIRHHFCRLALLTVMPPSGSGSSATLKVQDCRNIFPPLIPPPAVHITSITWPNDDMFAPFFTQGISITFDAAVNPQSVNASTMILTLEAPPLPATPATGGLQPFRVPLILDGTFSFPAANTVHFQPVPNTLVQALTLVRLPGRVRVRLKGCDIWSDQPNGGRIYLDGNTLGRPGATTLTGASRIDVTLPSGSGSISGDFESWFQVTPPVFQVGAVNFLIVAPSGERSSSAGIIHPPLPAGQVAQFASTEGVNQIEIDFSGSANPNTTTPAITLQLNGVTIPGTVGFTSPTTARWLPPTTVGGAFSFVKGGSYKLTVASSATSADGIGLGTDAIVQVSVI
jgi:hypothetical protein